MNHNKLHKLSFLTLRLMGSLIFIAAGFNHLLQTAGATARLEQAAFSHLATWIAPADTLIILSGIGLLAGGFLLLVGYQTRLAALLLLLILIPITLTVQVANAAGSGPLFKNIALIGMLLFFIINGAMYYGLDQLLRLKKKAGEKTIRKVHTLSKGNYVAVMATGLMLLLGSCDNISSTGNQAANTPDMPATTDQSRGNSPQKYAVLISQPNHLKAAVNTAETITSDSRYNRETFVIMACGKSVEAFVKGSDMAGEYEKGKAAGVTYKICGMSLKQFNIDQNTLIEGLEIIPNGLTYMFDLQQQGYTTVEL